MGLRVEEVFDAYGTVRMGAPGVNGGQIVKAVPVLESVHGRIVDGQEGREVVESVGRLDLLDRGLADVNTVLAGECQLEAGLKGAFRVQVQLSLG